MWIKGRRQLTKWTKEKRKLSLHQRASLWNKDIHKPLIVASGGSDAHGPSRSFRRGAVGKVALARTLGFFKFAEVQVIVWPLCC